MNARCRNAASPSSRRRRPRQGGSSPSNAGYDGPRPQSGHLHGPRAPPAARPPMRPADPHPPEPRVDRGRNESAPRPTLRRGGGTPPLQVGPSTEGPLQRTPKIRGLQAAGPVEEMLTPSLGRLALRLDDGARPQGQKGQPSFPEFAARMPHVRPRDERLALRSLEERRVLRDELDVVAGHRPISPRSCRSRIQPRSPCS